MAMSVLIFGIDTARNVVLRLMHWPSIQGYQFFSKGMHCLKILDVFHERINRNLRCYHAKSPNIPCHGNSSKDLTSYEH